MVGSSAGGSLAVNILGELHDPNLAAITLCSRLNEQPIKRWDKRSLKHMALDRKHSSQAFYDSVLYCTDTTIPKLTEAEKQGIITVQQWSDDVVPRPTMNIPDVLTYKVPGFGHGWGYRDGRTAVPTSISIA